MKKLITLFLLVSVNISLAQESVLLRLNYEKGATYNVSMKMNQEMGTMMSMGMIIDMDIKVTDVQEETYESEMKFTKMTMDMLQAGNVMSYDSTKSDEELDAGGKMMKAQMSPMLNALIYTKGNNLGEILEATVEPSVMGMEDIAKQSSSVVYPKEAIKVGSTWTNTKDDKGMKLEYVYTVKSISKDTVVLEVSGKVSGIGEGMITGNMDIDRSSGIPKNSTIDMALSVSGQEMSTKVTMEMEKI